MLHIKEGGGIMSVTLAQAYETAMQAIGDGMRITSAAEGTGHWFFGVGDAAVESVPGGSPIVIDKGDRRGGVSYAARSLHRPRRRAAFP